MENRDLKRLNPSMEDFGGGWNKDIKKSPDNRIVLNQVKTKIKGEVMKLPRWSDCETDSKIERLVNAIGWLTVKLSIAQYQIAKLKAEEENPYLSEAYICDENLRCLHEDIIGHR